MKYIISVIILGCNFSPLIIRGVDFWSAQGYWVQGLIAVAFSWSFFEKPIKSTPINVPLGLLNLWVGLFTAYICWQFQRFNAPNHTVFYPYFNFLCLLIFYHFICSYLDRQWIERIMTWMKYAVIIVLMFCVLQKLGISEFFALEHPDNKHLNNIVVGFLGNGTHLSGYLGMCVPLFLWKSSREDYLGLALLIIVLTQIGTTVGEPSISGIAITIFIMSVFYFVYERKMFYAFMTGVTLLSIFIAFNFSDIVSKLFNSNGRLGWWAFYWEKFTELRPITGTGLGKINRVHLETPYPGLRHLHLEYFHFMFELGIIGIVLIINVIQDFIKRESEDRTAFILKLMVIGFLISCLFNWSAHLWVPSTWAMFCYASFMVLTNKGNANGNVQKRDTGFSLRHNTSRQHPQFSY